MISERFIFITVSSVALDDMTQICLAIINTLHDLDLCIVIT